MALFKTFGLQKDDKFIFLVLFQKSELLKDMTHRFLINMLTVLNGSHFYFYLLLLQLVLCRVAALKSLPVHHP